MFFPGIDVLEIVTLEVEGEGTLTYFRDAFKGLRKVQVHGVFSIRQGPGKFRHAVAFRLVDGLVFRAFDFQAWRFDGFTIGKVLIRQQFIVA